LTFNFQVFIFYYITFSQVRDTEGNEPDDEVANQSTRASTVGFTTAKPKRTNITNTSTSLQTELLNVACDYLKKI
jgi:hypothetical protein